MRQQLFDPIVRMRGQACEYVLQVGVRVMPVHLRRLDQTHDGRRTSTRSLRASEQPILAPKGDGPDLVLDPVIVCALLRHDLVGRCKPDPATLAPAGSTGGDSGGNK